MSKPEMYGEYTVTEIQDAMRRHHLEGRPEKRNKIRYFMERGEDIPAELMDFRGIKSEKEIEGRLDMPPRSGRGSGDQAWRDFAEKVSDLAPEVLATMGREEIWEILETREIIPKEENDQENDEGSDGDSDENPDENPTDETDASSSQEEQESESESNSEEDE